MAGTLQPLDGKFGIVNPDGTPTLYFIKWAQQRQLDISQGITEQDLLDYLLTHKLQEGIGIQITPSGNLSDSPTIAADVQEILDTLSATRGVIIYRGLTGWTVLLPGTAGQFLKTNGPGADPSWAAGGGGGSSNEAPRTLPRIANFTFNNGGLATTGITYSDKTYSMLLQRGTTAVGNHSVLEFNTAPSTSAFTATARFGLYSSRYSTAYQSCLYLRNSTSGRLIVFGVYNVNTQPLIQGWSGLNGGFATDIIVRPNLYGFNNEFPWRQIVLTGGTTLDFQHSCDGEAWYSLGTTTLATYINAAGGTVDKVGVGCWGNDNGAVVQSFTLT